MIRKCVHCGKPFDSIRGQTLCSAECRRERKKIQAALSHARHHEEDKRRSRERYHAIKKSAAKPSKKQLSAVKCSEQRRKNQAMAKELGISYGQYVAWLHGGLLKEVSGN